MLEGIDDNTEVKFVQENLDRDGYRKQYLSNYGIVGILPADIKPMKINGNDMYIDTYEIDLKNGKLKVGQLLC
jgi:hypothetical protein